MIAEQYLLDAAKQKDRDPHWFEAMQDVAFGIGWDKANARDLLNQSVAFEPSYYHYYREYADYLKPQWYGNRGEITKYAAKASEHLQEPDASILYFRITSTLACNCEPQTADLPGLDWPKYKAGYDAVTQLYGPSNLNSSRVAWVAYKLNDKPAAQDAFRHIDKMEMSRLVGAPALSPPPATGPPAPPPHRNASHRRAPLGLAWGRHSCLRNAAHSSMPATPRPHETAHFHRSIYFNSIGSSVGAANSRSKKSRILANVSAASCPSFA